MLVSCGGGDDENLDSPNNPNTPNNPTPAPKPDDSNTVTLTAAGTLKTTLGENYLDISTLKIIGPINGSDIYCLREMAGGGEDENVIANLSTLDLSEAEIMGGGKSYYGDEQYTSHHKIGDHMFQACNLLCNIVLPNSTTSIGYDAFYGCYNLTSITIPDIVTSIGHGAFSDCHALKSITIPDKITTIEGWTFEDCNSLTSITIPKNVTSIGTIAFQYCNSLTKVYCYATTPPEIEDSFRDTPNEKKLYIPKGCVTAYEASDWAIYFENIVEMD